MSGTKRLEKFVSRIRVKKFVDNLNGTDGKTISCENGIKHKSHTTTFQIRHCQLKWHNYCFSCNFCYSNCKYINTMESMENGLITMPSILVVLRAHCSYFLMLQQTSTKHKILLKDIT
jgi:hypothetical protein